MENFKAHAVGVFLVILMVCMIGACVGQYSEKPAVKNIMTIDKIVQECE